MIHYCQYWVRPRVARVQRSALAWPAVSAYGCRLRPRSQFCDPSGSRLRKSLRSGGSATCCGCVASGIFSEITRRRAEAARRSPPAQPSTTSQLLSKPNTAHDGASATSVSRVGNHQRELDRYAAQDRRFSALWSWRNSFVTVQPRRGLRRAPDRTRRTRPQCSRPRHPDGHTRPHRSQRECPVPGRNRDA